MTPCSIASWADVRRVERAPYAQFMVHGTVLAALQAVAERQPERSALTAIDEPSLQAPVRRWTCAQYLRELRRAANLFTRLAAGAPLRVALLLPPIPEAHFALWGAEAMGVACPINYQLNAEHVAELVRAAQANIVVALGPVDDLDIWSRAQGLIAQCPTVRHVVAVGGAEGALDFAAECARESGERLASSPATADGRRVAALFHTGGTTGAPKLAQHTQANQLHAAWGAAQMYGATEGDVILNGFPLFHVAGSFVYGLSILLAGGEVVLPTRLGLRNPALMARFGDVVQRHRVTLLATVPTVIAGLLSLPSLQREQLIGVRALLTGGSPLPDELAAAFEQRHGIPVRNILGMTECAGVIAIEPLAGPRTPGSCGLALPFTQVEAVRADGGAAAPGASGILRVRGPNVGPGYTDAARNPDTFEDGWLISGDIGHVDAAGRVFVTGRAKDVIIRGAHNIDPGMIEGALLHHPAVQMAAAVGEPDDYAGELPVAYVALKPGARANADEIALFAAPHIAERPAVPRRVEVIEAMPVTAIGKVYKPALRVRATQRALDERLTRAGLAGAVRLQVDDTARGLALHFELTDALLGPRVRELMKPFALTYTMSTAQTAAAPLAARAPRHFLEHAAGRVPTISRMTSVALAGSKRFRCVRRADRHRLARACAGDDRVERGRDIEAGLRGALDRRAVAGGHDRGERLGGEAKAAAHRAVGCLERADAAAPHAQLARQVAPRVRARLAGVVEELGVDHAGAADDAGVPVQHRVHRTGHLRHRAVVVVQRGRGGDVDAAGRHARAGLHALRRAPHRQPDQAQRIAAGVHQGAAAERRARADVGACGVAQREAEARLHRTHRAQRTQQLEQRAGLRLEPPRVRLEQQHAVAARRVEHRARLGQAHGQRLLAQHVAPALRGAHRPLRVQAVGQRNVDRVERVVVEQRVVAGMGARDAEVGRERARLGGVAAAHRVDAHQAARRDVARELARDVGAAEDAEAQRVGQGAHHVGGGAISACG